MIDDLNIITIFLLDDEHVVQDDDEDIIGDDWMKNRLTFEEEGAVLAKDANTKVSVKDPFRVLLPAIQKERDSKKMYLRNGIRSGSNDKIIPLFFA